MLYFHNCSITLTTIKAKVFILLKHWITFPIFTHGSDFLCFVEWVIDWLIDWLTNDQLTNESTNQQTDWLNIFISLLLVLWIIIFSIILGMHFKFKINALIYLKVWMLLPRCSITFYYYYCNDISEYTYWAADSMMLMASSLNSFSNGVLSLDFP